MKLRTAILAAALVIAAAAAWHTGTRIAPPPAPPVRPYAHSGHAAAIDAGLAFLLRHGDFHGPSAQVFILLDYLQRRFGLDARYAFQNTFDPEQHPPHDLEDMALMMRSVDPDAVATAAEIENADNELTRLMAEALHCDVHPLHPGYAQRLLALLEQGGTTGLPGYITTHVILCAQWLRERGCDDGVLDLYLYLPQFAEQLAEIVEIGNAETDLAFEAMAFLYYIGHGERVKPRWVETLVAIQQPNGAWAYAPGDSPHGHPTALALWVLLEKALPDAPKTPWTGRAVQKKP